MRNKRVQKAVALLSLSIIFFSSALVANAQEVSGYEAEEALSKEIVIEEVVDEEVFIEEAMSEEGIISTFTTTSEAITTRGIGYLAWTGGDVTGDGKGKFRTTGWANMVNAKTNGALYHKTTAAVANYYDTSQYKGAVSKWGTGKVYATSNWVSGWSWPKIMYSL